MTNLSELMRERLDAVDVPRPDLAVVRRRGDRIRGLRAVTAASAAIVAVVVVGLLVDRAGDGGGADRDRGVDAVGQLDFSQGLRAYAAPGGEIHLGGRTFPVGALDYLDTDATATPYGVVFYDRGRPMLLEESGDTVALEPEADTTDDHPTAKMDSQSPLVAYGVTVDGTPEVVVRDQSSGEEVARRQVAPGTVIDALDGGVVFLRTDAGTTIWDTVVGDEQPFFGPKTRVADVRGGVVLYDGPAPDHPEDLAYFLVPGATDAQLTYDGEHILYWSNRLEPTDGGKPIVLDQKATFFAVDTDGSILAAGPGKGSTAEMYDCEVPSGRCEDLGSLSTLHGDPMFIGVDM